MIWGKEKTSFFLEHFWETHFRTSSLLFLLPTKKRSKHNRLESDESNNNMI